MAPSSSGTRDAPERAEWKRLLSVIIKKNDNSRFKGEQLGVSAAGFVGSSVMLAACKGQRQHLLRGLG